MTKVLIIEDEALTRRLYAEAVDELGFEPLKAEGGYEGLSLLVHEEPDLVLLDIMMLHMDGVETLRRIRKLPSGMKVPVIIVTASMDPELEIKVAEAGADGYLRKPVTIDDLQTTIQQHLLAQNLVTYKLA